MSGYSDVRYKSEAHEIVGLSYARDIARRYGISFEDLRAQLTRKAAAGSG